MTSSFSDARHINTTAFHVVTLRCACLHVHTIFSLINHFLKHSVLFRKPVYKYTYKNVSYRKKDKNLSVISYLQNISPPLLIKNIILEVFPVDLLRLLNLLWSHYFSWRAGSRWGIKEEAGDSTDKEVGETNTAALVCFSTVHHDNQVWSCWEGIFVWKTCDTNYILVSFQVWLVSSSWKLWNTAYHRWERISKGILWFIRKCKTKVWEIKKKCYMCVQSFLSIFIKSWSVSGASCFLLFLDFILSYFNVTLFQLCIIGLNSLNGEVFL